jgi:2-haloacid dehalogenase
VTHAGTALYDTVVFDIGGVFLEWDPRHLYRTLLDSDDEIDAFLARVPLIEHNYDDNDRGVPIAVTVEALCAAYPDDHALITAWGDRLADMVSPSTMASRCSTSCTRVECIDCCSCRTRRSR